MSLMYFDNILINNFIIYYCNNRRIVNNLMEYFDILQTDWLSFSRF